MTTGAMQAPPPTKHTPVMLAEVLAALAPRAGGIYVDGTFGAGGYTRAILDHAPCRAIGIDRDATAIAEGRALEEEFAGRLRLAHGRYSDMEALVGDDGGEGVDGIALDIGVSSMQIDEPARGFSFRHDAPLDMRMGQTGETAADIVNTRSEDELTRIIRDYGEERRARAVARAICQARGETPIATTGRLADIVRDTVHQGAARIDPATRTFQALRIAVNDELGELARGLAAAERLLRTGGRLAVVSFHSLEDREVKAFLKARAGETPRGSRHLPDVATNSPDPTFKLLFRGARKAGEAEVAANPRARSARLRAAERTSAPVAGGRAAA